MERPAVCMPIFCVGACVDFYFTNQTPKGGGGRLGNGYTEG